MQICSLFIFVLISFHSIDIHSKLKFSFMLLLVFFALMNKTEIWVTKWEVLLGRQLSNLCVCVCVFNPQCIYT